MKRKEDDAARLTHDTVPPLSSLSPSLLKQFKLLSGGGVDLFRMMYTKMWNHLFPYSKLVEVAIIYTLPDILAKYYKGITVGDILLLLRLWFLSQGSKKTINTSYDRIHRRESFRIKKFIEAGYIVRTSFDPLHPYALRPASISKNYISWTPAGVAFMHKIIERMKVQAQNDVINGFSGRSVALHKLM